MHTNAAVKKRIDKLLVERGLAETREKAQALIMAGHVLINDQPAHKAGMAVSDDADIRLKSAPHPYVSRGGVKLEGALRHFPVEPAGKTCLDIGSSTGGFTHCLLLHGAERVYALDVDVSQLDWTIRKDPRVRTIEMNARFLELSRVGEAVDLVTIDASFISLTLLLPRLLQVMKPGALCLALVKPQFEAGKEHVGKGGIVRDEAVQRQAVEKVRVCVTNLGAKSTDVIDSPILGSEGNREFLLLAEF